MRVIARDACVRLPIARPLASSVIPATVTHRHSCLVSPGDDPFRSLSDVVLRRSAVAPVLSIAIHLAIAGAVLAFGGAVVREPPTLLVTEITFAPAMASAAEESALAQPSSHTPTAVVSPLPQPSPLSIPAPRVSAPVSTLRPVRSVASPVPTPAKSASAQLSETGPAQAVPNGETALSATVAVAGAGSPVPSAPAAPSAPAPSGPEYQMGAVETPAPAYPLSARRRGRQGTVLIRLAVSPEGQPETVSVVESSGDAALDEAAASTLVRWRLRPATENGRPVWGSVLVPVRFQLE